MMILFVLVGPGVFFCKIHCEKYGRWVLWQHTADSALVSVIGAFTFSFPIPPLPSLVNPHFAYR